MINKNFALISAFALLIALSAGCGTYRLVQVKVDTDMEDKPEITATPHIGNRIAQYRNVVISYSLEFYEPSLTDKAKQTTVLMSGRGMWITEIEREFLKKGFRVLSRQKYNELLREKGVNASKEAARLLGADMIVQINSLEYSRNASLYDRTTKDYSVYVSDSSGTKLARGRDSEENETAIQDARMLVDKDVDTSAYMALLDCKLIDAKTGELILFYRNQTFKLRSDRKPYLDISYLFKQKDKKWRLIDSSGFSVDRMASKMEKDESRSRSRENQIKINMIRAICGDFVHQLNQLRRKGKQGTLSPIAEPRPIAPPKTPKRKPITGQIIE